MPWLKVIIAGGTAALLLWVATAPTPGDRRRAQINALIERGEIGRLSDSLQARLETQLQWLTLHAGIPAGFAVNKQIRPGRLTVLVTIPTYESITGCGPGNALYDPVLDAIFLDEGLIKPADLPLLGSPGPYSMSSVETFGFVVSYVNFILAHELGHRQQGRKGAAFFYYGLNASTAGTLEEERAADRFAVSTIVKGYASRDVPELLRKSNALSAVGLKPDGLTSSDHAAADILGAMTIMSSALLFSSSPYSPYYFNQNHPSFLQRAVDAISSIEAQHSGMTFAAHAPVLREELARMAALAGWPHRELFFREPIVAIDSRGGSLWIGTRKIPSPRDPDLAEYLYRLPLEQLEVAAESTGHPVATRPVAVQKRSVRSDAADWIASVFENGESSAGMPPSQPGIQPVSERGFRLQTKWGGLAYSGLEWTWTARNGAEVRVAEADLKQAAERRWRYTDVRFGHFQRFAGDVAVPMFGVDASNRPVFRVITIKGPRPDEWSLNAAFRMNAGNDQQIDISGAIYWLDCWWIPMRGKTAGPGYQWQIWRIAADGDRKLMTSKALLPGLAGADAAESFLHGLMPENARTLPLSGHVLLFGYDQDSLYVIRPDGSAKLLFHPAEKGLRATDLGAGKTLFWMENATKAYLIDTTGRKTQ